MTTEYTSDAPVLPFANPDQFSFRVFTFGPFRIEWIDPATGQATPLPAERLHGRGAAPSLALLKALLGRPDRFATRDWIMDQFWPESKRRSAEERLDDVASSLRTLLRPEGSSAKLVQYVYGSDGRGAGYRLAGYPQIWCDADAFMWFVEHASLLDRMGQDSSACWQRAYELASRGMYLPEHLYEEWARVRRETLEGLLRDCVQRWSQLLRQAGHVDEAIRRLRTYWEERPTDEDALRLLLELLGERERFGEAEACYAKAEAALAEDGHAPDPRTREMIELVRALQIRRRSLSFSLFQKQAQNPGSHLAYATMAAANTIDTNGIMRPDWLGKETAYSSPSSNSSQVLSEDNLMASFDASRRSLLQQFFSFAGLAAAFSPSATVLEQYILGQERAKSIDPHTYLALQGLIETCWQLCNTGRMNLAEQILSIFLPEVIERASFQPEAAKLASQGLRLKSILCAHRLQLPQMLPLCQQSVAYAQAANDPDILSAALNGLAVAFKYNRQPLLSFEAYEAALLASERATPLLRSRVYAGAASMYAFQGLKQDAFRLIGLAYEQFPAHPENDPSFFSSDNGLFMIAYYEGLLHLALEQHEEARRAFESYKNHPDAQAIPERNRLEILNYLGRTAILAKDLEMYASCLEEGVMGALAIRSQKRLNEAVEIFQENMPRSWLAEPVIKQLQEKLPLPAPQP